MYTTLCMDVQSRYVWMYITCMDVQSRYVCMYVTFTAKNNRHAYQKIGHTKNSEYERNRIFWDCSGVMLALHLNPVKYQNKNG